jgi:hypothetical protein
MEEQARALRFSQGLEQSNYERDEYHGYWNSTFDENVTLQLELDRFNERHEEARAAARRSIRSPKAFWTRHWMRWWISVRCMDSIHHMAIAGT